MKPVASPLAAAGLLACAAEAFAQATPAVPDAGGSLLQVIFGLAVVLALLIGGLYLLKRLQLPRGAGASLLRVVAGTAVGPRERVAVIEIEDTWLVVGVAPGRVNMLHSLPRGRLAEQPAPVAGAEDFGKWLRQVMERRRDGR
jgi:flagellar protein FliO/FliZ